mgnify:FL=1
MSRLVRNIYLLVLPVMLCLMAGITAIGQSNQSAIPAMHLSSLTDSVFYRVAGLSRKGEDSVSGVSEIQFPRKSKTEVIIMPNPVFNNAALIINDEGLGDISCILYDMTGKSIRTYRLRKTTVYLQQILDMYSVPKGEYILSIRSAFVNESKRILKQ